MLNTAIFKKEFSNCDVLCFTLCSYLKEMKAFSFGTPSFFDVKDLSLKRYVNAVRSVFTILKGYSTVGEIPDSLYFGDMLNEALGMDGDLVT